MFLIMHAVPSKRADQVLEATPLLIHPLLFHDTKETHILFMLPCFRTFKTSEDLRLCSLGAVSGQSPVQKDYCAVFSGDTPRRKGGRQTGQREKLSALWF